MRIYPEYVKNVAGGPPLLEEFPEAPSQAFTRGAFVTLNSSGQLVEVSTAIDQVLGISSHAASGTTNAKVKIWVATPIAIFAISIAGSVQSNQNLVGRNFGIVKESNIWCVNTADETDVRLSVLGIDSRNLSGEANARIHVVIIPNVRQVQF